jgi:ribosomal protein S17E
MKNTFTLNDFGLFFYESNITEQNPDDELLEQFFKKEEEMRTGKKILRGVAVSPDKRILNNIFGYARALTVFKTKGAGIVNVLMN